MEERVLEHEILSALFTLTGFSVNAVGTEAKGHIPIFKRSYAHCTLHYGTLKIEDIEIKDFDYYAVSDALELLKHNAYSR